MAVIWVTLMRSWDFRGRSPNCSLDLLFVWIQWQMFSEYDSRKPLLWLKDTAVFCPGNPSICLKMSYLSVS